MPPGKKGFMKKPNLPPAPIPPSDINTNDAAAVTLGEDDVMFFADATGFAPNTTVSSHWDSVPAEGCASNETFSAERLGLTTDDAGEVRYTAKKETLRDNPEDGPRVVTVRVYSDAESATDSVDFP